MTRILDPFLKIYYAIIVNFDSKLITVLKSSLWDTIKPHNCPYTIIHSLTYSYVFHFFQKPIWMFHLDTTIVMDCWEKTTKANLLNLSLRHSALFWKAHQIRKDSIFLKGRGKRRWGRKWLLCFRVVGRCQTLGRRQFSQFRDLLKILKWHIY